MNVQVAVLAAVAVLLHVPAGRGYYVRSQNSERQLDADGTGMKQVPGESDVSNLDLGDLGMVEESVGNDLHDIRRREARPKTRSDKRQAESGDESGKDQRHEPNGKVVKKGISDFLKPQKEMIINFMKPILDRIKHKPKEPVVDNSSDPPGSPAQSTPAPSFTPSVASSSSDSNASSSTEPSASNSTNAPKTYESSAIVFPFYPSSANCGDSERHRSIDTLSLLFPDSQSDKGEQPFVFLPLTNTLMRVVEQQIVRESQSGGDLRRKLHN